jgi:hypothetical protein
MPAALLADALALADSRLKCALIPPVAFLLTYQCNQNVKNGNSLATNSWSEFFSHLAPRTKGFSSRKFRNVNFRVPLKFVVI